MPCRWMWIALSIKATTTTERMHTNRKNAVRDSAPLFILLPLQYYYYYYIAAHRAHIYVPIGGRRLGSLWKLHSAYMWRLSPLFIENVCERRHLLENCWHTNHNTSARIGCGTSDGHAYWAHVQSLIFFFYWFSSISIYIVVTHRIGDNNWHVNGLANGFWPFQWKYIGCWRDDRIGWTWE